MGGLHGVPAEAGGEDAVIGGGHAAALHMAEDDRLGLLAQAPLQLVGEGGADALEALMAVLVDRALAVVHGALGGVCALGDADHGELLAPREALLDHLDQVRGVEGPLGQADAVGAGGHAGLQRDPARVPAHDLDHHHPLVGLGGGLEAVHRLGGDAHRGVEAEGAVRGGDVVVDRLGHADDRETRVGEHPGRRQGALAADRDQRVDAELPDHVGGPLAGLPQPVPLQPGGAEDGAAQGQDAADRVQVEGPVVAVEQAPVAVLESNDLVVVLRHRAVHDRTDHGVQAGAVAACGENSDAHRAVSPARCLVRASAFLDSFTSAGEPRDPDGRLIPAEGYCQEGSAHPGGRFLCRPFDGDMRNGVDT
ncbi:hypothetical protein GPN2_22421 [Streptomyces murinus]